MTMGSPQVDGAALIDVGEPLTPAIKPAHYRIEQGGAREEGNQASHHADTG